MASEDFLLEVYRKLTGTNPPETGDFWSPALPNSPLAGYNIIYSGDRIPDTMPDRAYPYLVMEIGDLTSTERKDFKNATVYFSIGVIVKRSGSLQQIKAVSTAFAQWLDSTRFSSATKVYPTAINFTVGERRSQYIGTRYADITANAVVVERW